MRSLFISGMGRSGTTLLEKLLASHEEISVLSQPFPYYFIYAKEKFLHSKGIYKDYYALGNLFHEKRYDLEELNHFLNEFRLNRAQLNDIFLRMESFSGQYTKIKDITLLLESIRESRFINILKDLFYHLKHKQQISYCGSKETHCEEFLPYLTSNAVKCVLILRDPRDVITSFNFGKGTSFGGEHRPTLFYIRNWRKSVAFSIYLKGCDNFLAVKYEDLVKDPLKTLQRLSDFLKVSAFSSEIINNLSDQAGRRWNGNSAFNKKTNISKDSLGTYRKYLTDNVRKFVETLCCPELIYLGYPCESANIDNFSNLKNFNEPFPITRPEFRSDYNSCDENLSQEFERISLLKGDLQSDAYSIKKNFIFKEVYNELKEKIPRTVQDENTI